MWPLSKKQDLSRRDSAETDELKAKTGLGKTALIFGAASSTRDPALAPPSPALRPSLLIRRPGSSSRRTSLRRRALLVRPSALRASSAAFLPALLLDSDPRLPPTLARPTTIQKGGAETDS